MYTWITLKFLILECYIPVATRLALSFATCFDLLSAMHQDDANAAIPLEKNHKKLTLHSFLDMMQRIPRLSYNCTALTKWSPQIWKSAMICALQHISGVHIGVVPVGGCHYCCCNYMLQFTCQIMCQVGLKPLEKLSTNCTSITRRQHPCWLRLFEEWWEQNPNVLVWTTSFKQDQKCLFHTEHFEQSQKWLVCKPLVKWNNKNVKLMHKWHDKQNEI